MATPHEHRDRVLVVDDTEANRYVLTHLLRRTGYEVIEAASIAEAAAQLAKKPDLVVCDVKLPDGKGTDFTHQVKSDPATEKVMVVNMSASYTRTRDRVLGLDQGADAYLVQPVDPQEFLATVAALLRIRHAEQGLSAKNQELKLIAHAMSHDLREPLRMVSTYLDLVERPGFPNLAPKQAEYIRHARTAAKRMHQLIHDLVALTMVDRDGLALVPVDLGIAVTNALGNLDMLVQQYRPRLDLGPLPTVPCDLGLITQVFQNLLANAMKYHGDAPLTIAISAEAQGDHHRISVTDNGLGIPADAIDQLFVVFQRLHPTADVPGSGIGLALCKKIIDLHGGSIGCTSKPGHGSTFWFTLRSTRVTVPG